MDSTGGGVSYYYIEDRVYRAVALRENGIHSSIPAILFVSGKAPRRIQVRLDQLYSPRATVSRTPSRRRNFPALQAWLATAAGRAKMLPLHLQVLGEVGQSASLPLMQVQIVP